MASSTGLPAETSARLSPLLPKHANAPSAPSLGSTETEHTGAPMSPGWLPQACPALEAKPSPSCWGPVHAGLGAGVREAGWTARLPGQGQAAGMEGRGPLPVLPRNANCQPAPVQETPGPAMAEGMRLITTDSTPGPHQHQTQEGLGKAMA